MANHADLFEPSRGERGGYQIRNGDGVLLRAINWNRAAESGWANTNGFYQPDLEEVLESMADAARHRSRFAADGPSPALVQDADVGHAHRRRSTGDESRTRATERPLAGRRRRGEQRRARTGGHRQRRRAASRPTGSSSTTSPSSIGSGMRSSPSTATRASRRRPSTAGRADAASSSCAATDVTAEELGTGPRPPGGSWSRGGDARQRASRAPRGVHLPRTLGEPVARGSRVPGRRRRAPDAAVHGPGPVLGSARRALARPGGSRWSPPASPSESILDSYGTERARARARDHRRSHRARPDHLRAGSSAGRRAGREQ